MKLFNKAFFLFLTLFVGLLACQNESSGGEKPKQQEESVQTEKKHNIIPSQNDHNTFGIQEDYISTNRVIWQKPDMVIDLLGDLNGKTVADIGAGTGFFSLRMLSKAKKVIAIDIDPRFVDYLDSIKVLEVPDNLQHKLETRLAEPTDPHLQAGEADIVIIVNTYMYISDRTEYLANLKKGIAENGRLLIIDFKKKRTPIGPPSSYRVPLYQVEEELYEAGYKNIRTNDTALDYQYIIMAENSEG